MWLFGGFGAKLLDIVCFCAFGALVFQFVRSLTMSSRTRLAPGKAAKSKRTGSAVFPGPVPYTHLNLPTHLPAFTFVGGGGFNKDIVMSWHVLSVAFHWECSVLAWLDMVVTTALVDE